jgi:hypothetical protein
MNMFRAFMELDEAYNNRQEMINDIKKAGKNYNFARYTDAQLFRMWQRLQKTKLTAKEPAHELDLEFDDAYARYCDCGVKLSDAGFCPVCDDGEEDLSEDMLADNSTTLVEFVTASGKQVKLPRSNAKLQVSSAQAQTNSASATATPPATPSNNKFIVRIVSDKGRLRALATDGVHPGAWVSFPNDLRQYDGQKYEVDQLIWNGKNYRVSGNIVEI